MLDFVRLILDCEISCHIHGKALTFSGKWFNNGFYIFADNGALFS